MIYLYLIFTLIVAGALRFYNNTAVALWHDEAFSALYIKYPWGEMMYRIGLDVHPPLYYFILRFWSYIFGSGLLSLRGLSILFGVATVWAGFLFVKEASKNDKLALLAALFIAINPFQIQYALEARMYTLGTFLLLLSCYFFVKALNTGKKTFWVWYAILVAACFYTHYYLVFSVAAQGLYLIYWLIKNKKLTLNNWRDNQLINSFGSYLLAFILYIPWIPTLLTQIKRVENSYWIPAPDRWSIPGTIWKMIFGGQGINHTVLVLASLVTVILFAFFIIKIRSQEKWLVFLSLIVPFAGALLLSFKTAIYLDRYFVFASLFFSILIALAFAQINKKVFRNLLIAVFIGANVFAFFKNWKDLDVKNLFFDRQENRKPGMAKAAEFIGDSASPNDKIFVGSSFIFFTFKYYNPILHAGDILYQIKPLLISSCSIECIPHFSGTAILTNNDLVMEQDIKNGIAEKKNDIIWLLWTTGFGGSKPNVPGNWSMIAEKEFPDTPGFKGSIFVTEYRVN